MSTPRHLGVWAGPAPADRCLPQERSFQVRLRDASGEGQERDGHRVESLQWPEPSGIPGPTAAGARGARQGPAWQALKRH